MTFSNITYYVRMVSDRKTERIIMWKVYLAGWLRRLATYFDPGDCVDLRKEEARLIYVALTWYIQEGILVEGSPREAMAESILERMKWAGNILVTD